jgi:hypothetical protein
MESQSKQRVRERVSKIWATTRTWVSHLSLTVRIMLGLFLFAALLMALHTAFSEKDSSLRLTVQHGFRNADISVLVDGHVAYSGKLNGSAKKKFGGLIASSAQGSLSEIIPISSGSHQIRVQVQSDGGGSQQDTVSGDFAANTERKLSVSARPGSLSLAWAGSSTAAPPPSGSSWFTHYASALFLTIGGSIVSALTGFALRELPGHIRARQQNETVEAKAHSATAGQ